MTPREDTRRPLHERIAEWPLALPGGRASAVLSSLKEQARADPALSALADALEKPETARLVAGIAGGSPYLEGLVARDLPRLGRFLVGAPEDEALRLEADMTAAFAGADMAGAMRAPRVYKTGVALLVALADLAGVWTVAEVTDALAAAADATLREAVRFLFRLAAARGDWRPDDPGKPEEGSGFIVLGMGKYGARELNYSSDIDLIVLYDPERSRLRDGLEIQAFFVRLTRDLVRLMAERTRDGYVFRVDLRLRPDAGATQIALSTAAALDYYEACGQNWERAAFIKARAAAGDIAAGEKFLDGLQPFVWRRYLDFAAIADIHAMKRQIHAFRGFGAISVPGHNIKLGPGGIREIEFFAQTQQLIAGGRQADLRVRSTVPALAHLAARGWIAPAVAADLTQAYFFLRRIEHRIQMVLDEQTHDIPESASALDNLARLSGHESREPFSQALRQVFETVQRHYAALFEMSPALTSGAANMVFAGEEDDPATVEALTGMGFSQPSQVLATVRGWHHGRVPAVRSPAARERLTEVQPLLIAALADTADPGGAFASFDRFLSELPAGVQLFSLLKANPGLLRLVADIMGTAPRLARILSRRRRLLDAVIDPRTSGMLPGAESLDRLIASEFANARDIQDVLDRARVIGGEQAFLVGVRVLSGTIGANQAGGAYALIAERLIAALQEQVETELARAHGPIPGGGAAVVAMGKLGGREMTAASDLDLIVVYDYDPETLAPPGARGLHPSQYYTRLTQRMIAALSAPTAEGTLYEVDLRLRPSGQKGPVATQLSSFVAYQANEAWTWEHLALTRARVVTGSPALRAKVEQAIRDTLVRPRDAAKIGKDVREMRARIAAEKGTGDIWDLKQARGGLVDLEFIAQYLQLIHAARRPDVLDQNTVGALRKLVAAGVLDSARGETLIAAARLLHDLTQVLRLCAEGPFDPKTAPPGLRALLSRAGDAPDFERLTARVAETLAEVHGLFEAIVV